MSKCLYILLVILTFLPAESNSQAFEPLPPFWDIKSHIQKGKSYEYLRISQFKYTYIGAGVERGVLDYVTYSSYGAGIDFSLNDDKFIISPNIHYSLVLIFASINLDINYYTDFSNSSFSFKPSLGLSLLTLADLTYGYNFLTNPSTKSFINTHNISLTIRAGLIRNIFLRKEER